LPGPPPPPAAAAAAGGLVPASGPGSEGGPASQQLSGPPSFTLRRNAAGGVGSRCADTAWWFGCLVTKAHSVHACPCSVDVCTGCWRAI
jgi:hypothetical protein